MRFLFALVLSIGLVRGGTTDLTAQTRAFLDAYARGDRQRVLALIDRAAIVVYGSDAAEVFRGAADVESMLSNDLRLWGGTAQIGPMDHVTVIETKNLTSLFFDAPFSAGGRPPLPVRFAMVWRRSGKKWLLVQSSNVVPTQGQSAAQLLQGDSKGVRHN